MNFIKSRNDRIRVLRRLRLTETCGDEDVPCPSRGSHLERQAPVLSAVQGHLQRLEPQPRHSACGRPPRDCSSPSPAVFTKRPRHSR